MERQGPRIFRDARSRLVLRVVFAAAALVYAVLSLLFSQIDLERNTDWRSYRQRQDNPAAIGAEQWAAGLLNYRTLAADLAWMEALIYFGEIQRAHRRPQHLLRRGEIVTELDARWMRPYLWMGAAYINSRVLPTHDDIARINAFLDRGIRAIPNRYDLPYMAGMNYIGYVREVDPARRKEEYRRAIDYLSRAASLEGAPPHLPLTVSWFYTRLHDADSSQLSKREERQRQIDFYLSMYALADQPDIQLSLIERLETLGAADALLARQRALDQKYRLKLHERFSYLAPPLWLLVVAPTTQVLQEDTL